MVATFPQGANTYVPSHEASHNMIVDFSRNPNTFPIAKYCQIVPVKQQVGYYLVMNVEKAGRVLDEDGNNYNWPDGAESPRGNDGTEGFQFLPFITVRKAYAYNVGHLASGQAGWDVLAQNGRIFAQKAMTIRTSRVVKVATTAGNYDAAHTSAVASISGVTGKWDLSTTARLDIKRSIDYGLDVIRRDTLGAVMPDQIQLVLSPGCARKMAASQEIADFVKGSPAAERYIKEGLGPNSQYGLPSTYSGVPIVVEDAVKVTSKKGATKTTSYVMPDDKPFLSSRVGELEGVYGAPSFSTITIFAKEEMTVESKDDSDNRRTKGRVVDDVGIVLTAPVSGFLFTDAVTV